jgi:hypothetical protein
MAFEKKSLISSRSITQKAIVASNVSPLSVNVAADSKVASRMATKLVGKQATKLVGKQATKLVGKQATKLVGKQATKLVGKQASKFAY